MESKLLSMGFTMREIQATIDEYEKSGVLVWNEDKSYI